LQKMDIYFILAEDVKVNDNNINLLPMDPKNKTYTFVNTRPVIKILSSAVLVPSFISLDSLNTCLLTKSKTLFSITFLLKNMLSMLMNMGADHQSKYEGSSLLSLF
jgi:hypothetical protein